jgi:hypothetical protein
MGRVFYYANTCPLSHECTSQSWKKARCWGWTIDEAQDYLMQHVSKSGHHSHRSRQEKEDIVATFSFITDVSDEVPSESEESEPGRKRSKHQPSMNDYPIGARRPATGSSGSGASAPATPPPNAVLESRIAVRDRDTITISRQQLDSAMDSINRAYSACRHAQKLSAAAAEAFSQESEVLLEAKSAVEAIRRLV